MYIVNSVTYIGASAFFNCSKLEDIFFDGTAAEWRTIEKEEDWDKYMGYGSYTVHCSDGNIEN